MKNIVVVRKNEEGRLHRVGLVFVVLHSIQLLYGRKIIYFEYAARTPEKYFGR